MADSIYGMIESRKYLLDFQKRQLLEDLRAVEPDDERIGKIIDSVFYKLFGIGWNDLSAMEIQDIYDSWERS